MGLLTPPLLPAHRWRAWPSTALLSMLPHPCRWPSHCLPAIVATVCPASLHRLSIGYSFLVARLPKGTTLSQPSCLPLAGPREGQTATGRGRQCRLRGGQAGFNCPALGQSQVISVNREDKDEQGEEGRSKPKREEVNHCLVSTPQAVRSWGSGGVSYPQLARGRD